MGLAASQARFLCLTARKASCEYKSTELAQQKLEITNQLADISNDYGQALNSTKLMWSNDGIDGDYGLTYSLLMSPSPMNDFNPYMITTPSGAVVLNDKYAAAARAAGISKAGGIGSQMSRDKFISALSSQGIVTEATAQKITQYDYKPVVDSKTNKITFENENTVTNSGSGLVWNPAAGMGAEPLNKGAAQSLTLADLIMSETIGLQYVDWAKVAISSNEITEIEYNRELDRLDKLRASLNAGVVSDDVINQLYKDLANYKNNNKSQETTDTYKNEVARLEKLIECAKNIDNIDEVDGKKYLTDSSNNRIKVNGKDIEVIDALTNIKAQIINDYDTYVKNNNASAKKLKDIYNISANDLDYDDNKSKVKNALGQEVDTGKVYSIVQNGVINHYEDELKYMTIGDLLSEQIVLMANSNIPTTPGKTESGNKATDLKAFSEAVTKILDSIVSVFGYSATENLRGIGFNVDDASEEALKFAYEMVRNNFLRPNSAVDTGSRKNDHSMTDNSAYINATTYNSIGTDDSGKYFAVSISQMVASFLTYYENALSGSNTSYVVGKSKDTSIYVTDNSGYMYYVQASDDVVTSNVNKDSDFFDQLYNNILEHGWREDDAIDDNEYLEASLKNGRYSMSSLNQDGYFYQTRYNDTGYMVEVSDTDAIARAEAEFTAKKAELTYKEDSIDIKTKKLDAEIAAISTEVESVKNIIAKGIEKTFSMFSN